MPVQLVAGFVVVVVVAVEEADVEADVVVGVVVVAVVVVVVVVVVVGTVVVVDVEVVRGHLRRQRARSRRHTRWQRPLLTWRHSTSHTWSGCLLHLCSHVSNPMETRQRDVQRSVKEERHTRRHSVVHMSDLLPSEQERDFAHPR